MAGKYYRKRRVVRKRKVMKSKSSNYVLRRGRGAAKGGFYITRKLPLITMTASNVAGLPTISDPTGTCLQTNVIGASPGTSGQYDVAFSLKFSLNQLQSFTDITQIADQYKIKSVLVKLVSGFQLATGVGAAPAWVEYIQDHDDANVPTLAVMRQKMGVRTKFFGPTRTQIKMGVRPRTADEVFSNGIVTGYGVNSPQWINCDYPAVEHYAIKGILHNVYLNGTANQGLLTFDISMGVAAQDLQ